MDTTAEEILVLLENPGIPLPSRVQTISLKIERFDMEATASSLTAH